jgi:hypothetical protein
MSSNPISPVLLKGAIIGVDPLKPAASLVIFQYNPDTLQRTLTPQAVGGDASRSEALRLKGPPQETIKVDIEIDAADQLETDDPLAASLGLYPALSALEMLVYPSSALSLANEVLLNTGVIEIIPAEGPLTLFVWGPQRLLPVRITEFSITEEAYDPHLNPLRAKVSLGMRVLSYYDLGLASAGGALFMAHQVAKEALATVGSAAGLASGAFSTLASLK